MKRGSPRRAGPSGRAAYKWTAEQAARQEMEAVASYDGSSWKEARQVYEIPLSKIRAWEVPGGEKGRRLRSNKNMEKIAEAIESGQALPPIVVNPKMIIEDGHHRFFAAKLLGLRTIPAIMKYRCCVNFPGPSFEEEIDFGMTLEERQRAHKKWFDAIRFKKSQPSRG